MRSNPQTLSSPICSVRGEFIVEQVSGGTPKRVREKSIIFVFPVIDFPLSERVCLLRFWNFSERKEEEKNNQKINVEEKKKKSAQIENVHVV